MRQIQIRPVRENEAENQQRWRRRAKLLGSLLHWAHDAGATRIEFDPSQNEPFLYITPCGENVTTELGRTPPEYASSLAQWLRDTIDRHPLIRAFRRTLRYLTGSAAEAKIDMPPTDIYSESTWHCKMNGDNAVFTKQSDTKPNGTAV